jgi:hypothetical protein
VPGFTRHRNKAPSGPSVAKDRRPSIGRLPERRATVRGSARSRTAQHSTFRGTCAPVGRSHRFLPQTSMQGPAPQRHGSSSTFDALRHLRQPSGSSQGRFGALRTRSIFVAANGADVRSRCPAPTGRSRRRRTRAAPYGCPPTLEPLAAIPTSGLKRPKVRVRSPESKLRMRQRCNGSTTNVLRPIAPFSGDLRPSRQHSLPETPCGQAV